MFLSQPSALARGDIAGASTCTFQVKLNNGWLVNVPTHASFIAMKWLPEQTYAPSILLHTGSARKVHGGNVSILLGTQTNGWNIGFSIPHGGLSQSPPCSTNNSATATPV